MYTASIPFQSVLSINNIWLENSQYFYPEMSEIPPNFFESLIMEHFVQKRFWRKCLDILLIVLLSGVAVNQVFQSCVKFLKGYTTETVSVRDLDQTVCILFYIEGKYEN